MPLTINRKQPKKNLVYTIAFDAPQSESYRFLGRMLASSLLRTFFTGDIVIFRNSPAPLFLVERKGLDEVYLETPPMHGQERAEMAVAAERDGANSGTLAVRGQIFHEVMAEWARIDESKSLRDSGFRDQASWNKVLLTCGVQSSEDGGNAASQTAPPAGIVPAGVPGAASGSQPVASGEEPSDGTAPGHSWRAEPFPPGEVQFPCYLDPHYADYTRAALTHNIAANTREKVEFTFGLYMRTFFCDPTGVFFSMLEM